MIRIARGGATWVVTPISLAILLVSFDSALGGYGLPLSMISLAVATSLLWFFRDPQRGIAKGIVCPADGKVVRVDQPMDADIGEADRIAIFMSPLDVHVNRAPVDGNVIKVTHHPGKHVPAFNKDSDRNERVEILLQTEHGLVKIVQIAGAMARRCVPYVEPGQHVKAGDRIGLIRLSSRCDLYFPRGAVSWNVEVGTRVKASISKVGEA
ncbi:MAG: phosphatidylserine decarboxylase [Thermoplasmatota archaeon]